MSLKGKRVLVLQAEYLVALDVQTLLEKRGAIVSVEEPKSDGPSEFDALVVDSTYAVKPIAARMFAAGIHLIGYTGDATEFQRLYPGCVVINKPSPPDVLVMAIAHHFDPVDDDSSPPND